MANQKIPSNNMKTQLLAGAFLIAISSMSNAANFIISNVSDGLTDTLFANGDNSPSTGGIVTLGVFASGFNVPENLLNFAALTANFTIFAAGVTGGASTSLGLASAPGYAEFPLVENAPLVTGNPLIGQTLYLFFGNKATLGESDELVLLNMGALQNEDAVARHYAANPAFRVGAPLLGTFDSVTGDFGGQGVVSTFTTVHGGMVPEPSAALLGVVGALGLLRRRRN